MGDILVTSTILPLLKEKYPDAKISFLLDEKYQQILIGNPYLDDVIFWKGNDFTKMISTIRKEKFDIVIDVYSTIDTGFLTQISGAKKRIGFFKKYTQICYNMPVERRQEALSEKTTLGIEHRLQLLEPLGIDHTEVFPKIYLSDDEIEDAEQILTKSGLTKSDQLIMISTFGSSPDKTYPLDYMANILDHIVDYQPDSKLLCNYLSHQKDQFTEIYSLVSEKTQRAIVKDFETSDLRQFAAVTSLCTCLIGNEGGATNISKALQIPTFSIFAPHIDLKGWAWTSNSNLDRFLHLNDFVENSSSYEDFKPEFLHNTLKEFLQNLNHKNQ